MSSLNNSSVASPENVLVFGNLGNTFEAGLFSGTVQYVPICL
jgi:hypothetical protein